MNHECSSSTYLEKLKLSVYSLILTLILNRIFTSMVLVTFPSLKQPQRQQTLKANYIYRESRLSLLVAL